MKTENEQKLIELLKQVPVPLVQKISDYIGKVIDEYFNKGYEEGQLVGYKQGKAEGLAKNYRSACVDYSNIVQETKDNYDR